jgi:IS5 family transposase
LQLSLEIHIFYQDRTKKLGDEMVKYKSSRQLSFAEFRTPFEKGLDGTNRWVRLAEQIPWDDLARIYVRSLRDDFGRPSVDARVVIGAMIIKHKKSLTDEETVAEIQENPYLQFFLGFKEFNHKRIFDPSLFVTLRKRMGTDVFEQMNQAFMSTIESSQRRKARSTNAKGNKHSNDCQENTPAKKQSDTANASPKQATNQGKLIVDASVVPQDIKYPTDLDLLNASREKTEQIIDELYVPESKKRKPRTYRKNARKDYLAIARKKKKNNKELRKAIRKQLNYVKRNIKTIHSLLDLNPQSLSFRSLRSFWIIQEVYRQQQEMYDKRSHTISDRIVSISQPHVRPIVRGKAGKDVEFGAKLSVSLVNGFAHLDRLSWDAYNESIDLVDQVEAYRDRYGFYPEVVLADQIYGSRDNRNYLESKGIRFSGKPLGRPPKLSRKEKRMLQSEARLRGLIEGKFGEGKRKYDLDLVKAKTMYTSESWIAAIFFVMNLAHWWRLDFFVFFSSVWYHGFHTISKNIFNFKSGRCQLWATSLRLFQETLIMRINN